MFFRGVPLFEGLSEAHHALLLQMAVRRTYPRHALIVQEGDPGERFFLLRRGRAKVYLGNPDGREVILAILGSGDFFGEMALVDDESCSASVMAFEESEFVSIGKAEFQQVLATSPDMAASLLKALSKRLREADRQIESLALNDVRARVEQALRSLARPEGDELVISSRVTHRDIAAMVGTSREVVTRIFRSLEEGGVVKIDGRRIILVPSILQP